ncbi:MAG TPA: 50S ribosomal protein L6 [Rhodothermales bacterium]|nr:50S ribosomal protein L6 [Rhodothermales bacterium]
MSRIGKLPITLPEGVEIQVQENNVVVARGPKGTIGARIDPDMTVSMEDGVLTVIRPTEQKRHRALHGLSRSLIQNLITGVTDGYRKQLDVIGVGYRAEVKNGVLELALGFSHPIYFIAPGGVALTATTERGQPPKVFVEGIDKQLVGQVAAKIRGLRPPEPYKGKGIRYTDEFVRRKAGKTAAR